MFKHFGIALNPKMVCTREEQEQINNEFAVMKKQTVAPRYYSERRVEDGKKVGEIGHRGTFLIQLGQSDGGGASTQAGSIIYECPCGDFDPLKAIFSFSGSGANSNAVALSTSPRSTNCEVLGEIAHPFQKADCGWHRRRAVAGLRRSACDDRVHDHDFALDSGVSSSLDHFFGRRPLSSCSPGLAMAPCFSGGNKSKNTVNGFRRTRSMDGAGHQVARFGGVDGGFNVSTSTQLTRAMTSGLPTAL